MVDKKQWFKEFYQIKDGCQWDGFYASKRRAKVILEEVSEPKYKMYEAVVIAIEPLEEFEIKGVDKYYHHQYRLGDRFVLRQHKGEDKWWNPFSPKYWFDVRRPGNEIYEGFKLYNV